MANNKRRSVIQNETTAEIELQSDSVAQQEGGVMLPFELKYPKAKEGQEINVNDFFNSLIEFQNNLVACDVYENSNNKAVVITQATLPIATHFKICDTNYCGITIEAGDKFSIKLSNSITIESISND